MQLPILVTCLFLALCTGAFSAEAPAADAKTAETAVQENAAEEKDSNAATADEICETLASAAQDHELPVGFFLRLIWQESRFDPKAVSTAGAQGVAQFMPRVAAAMGLSDPFDPIEALPMSARLLRSLLRQFGNIGLAAAAYNAGPTRVNEWLGKGGALPRETRQYVAKITGYPVHRWRKTTVGNLEFEPPKRAPCQEIVESAENFVGQIPSAVEQVKTKTQVHISAAKKEPKGKAAKKSKDRDRAASKKTKQRPSRSAKSRSSARSGKKSHKRRAKAR